MTYGEDNGEGREKNESEESSLINEKNLFSHLKLGGRLVIREKLFLVFKMPSFK